MRTVTRRVLQPGRRLRPERAKRHMDRSLPDRLVLSEDQVFGVDPAVMQDRVYGWAGRVANARGWTNGYAIETSRPDPGGPITFTIHPNKRARA